MNESNVDDLLKKSKNNAAQEVIDYVHNVGNRISDLKRTLIKETHEKFSSDAVMLTDPSEGELLKMLVKLSGSKKGIELGVFTGYSSICMAEALPDDGKLLCLDVSENFTSLARKYWDLTGLNKKTELILKPGLEILDSLLNDEKNIGAFDFAYVDADKENYINYLERLIKLIHPGGWIAFDNTLWSYKVVYDQFNDEKTEALKKLNAFLQGDQRVEINMVPISDGLTIVRIR